MRAKILLLFTLLLFTIPAPAHAQNVPPSVFYGWVTPSGDFAPTVGMVVTGSVGGQVCGTTEVIPLEGQLAYVLHVNSAEDQAGCGVLGSTVVFRVGQWEMAHDASWSNSGATFWPLSTVRQPTPTPTATPTATPTETPTPIPTNTPVVITLTPTRTPTPTPSPTTPAPTETPTPSTMPSATPTEPAPPARAYLPLVDR